MDKIELKTKHDKHVTNNAVFYPYEYMYIYMLTDMYTCLLFSKYPFDMCFC